MQRFRTVDGAGAHGSVSLESPLGRGATGTVYRVNELKGKVAKIYDPTVLDVAHYRGKVAAMIAAPPSLAPFSFQGDTYVQIAWPTESLFDYGGGFRGFLMPEIDQHAATEVENILQRSKRRALGLPEFYGGRVLLASNLASLMAALHAQGHFMIDMKPVNLRFFPKTWYAAILDTDGFSINGTRRWPAQQFSDEYIAPEAKGLRPDQLGVDQDLFSLAVIIFRLLNNGIHPYQGRDLSSSSYPTTIQDRIFADLYAYSVSNKIADIAPTMASIHEYFEADTRDLFDRAFRSSGARPTADEWSRHLKKLITAKILSRCGKNPEAHAHFSRGCGLCAIEGAVARARQSPAASTPPVTTTPARAAGAKPPGPRQGTPTRRKILRIASVLAPIVALAGGLALLGERKDAGSTPPPVPPPRNPPPERTGSTVVLDDVIVGLLEERRDERGRLLAPSYTRTNRVQSGTRNLGMVVQYRGASANRTVAAFELRAYAGGLVDRCQSIPLSWESGSVYCIGRNVSLSPGAYEFLFFVDDVPRWKSATIWVDNPVGRFRGYISAEKLVEVRMDLRREANDSLSGKYVYTEHNSPVDIIGRFDGERLLLSGYHKGRHIDSFEGRIVDRRFSGTYTRQYDMKTMPFAFFRE